MANLLAETLEALSEAGKTPDDVRWVGSADGEHSIPWAEFAVLADCEYDNGFSWQEIASDLVVVGDGWWLARGEHAGREWWDLVTPPVQAPTPKAFAVVMPYGPDVAEEGE